MVSCLSVWIDKNINTLVYIIDCPFPNLIEMWLPTYRLMFFDFVFEKKCFLIFLLRLLTCASLRKTDFFLRNSRLFQILFLLY